MSEKIDEATKVSGTTPIPAILGSVPCSCGTHARIWGLGFELPSGRTVDDLSQIITDQNLGHVEALEPLAVVFFGDGDDTVESLRTKAQAIADALGLQLEIDWEYVDKQFSYFSPEGLADRLGASFGDSVPMPDGTRIVVIGF